MAGQSKYHIDKLAGWQIDGKFLGVVHLLKRVARTGQMVDKRELGIASVSTSKLKYKKID